MISLGRHLGSLLLGLAITALLVSGLSVAAPVGGPATDLADTLSSAVRAAAAIDTTASGTAVDTVSAPADRLRPVPRALVAGVPVSTTPATAPGAGAPTTSPRVAKAGATQPAPTAAAKPAEKAAAKPADKAAAKPATKPTEKAATKPAGKAGKPARRAAAGGGAAAAMVAATNAKRKAAGCEPLQVDGRLSRAAQRHASDMAAGDYFSHTDQDGNGSADRIQDAGFGGSATGENIAYGQETAAEVVSTWMSSSDHRRNILDCSYDRVGVGYDSHGDYWVQDFGG